jgi:hypothetical protein
MGRLGGLYWKGNDDIMEFPMIPPQVNGATITGLFSTSMPLKFPMIPPQVNGATKGHSQEMGGSAIVSNDSAPS